MVLVGDVQEQINYLEMVATMSAVLSPCGMYRYRLDRQLTMGDGPVYAFFGINPSTADASLDDATVRKWTGFCKRWGASRYIVGNVFPYRATDVKELGRCEQPIGDFATYAKHMKQITVEADILVPCWGNTNKVPPALRSRFASLLRALPGTGKPIKVFGLTKSGDPMHPLMLGYDTILQDWTTP